MPLSNVAGAGLVLFAAAAFACSDQEASTSDPTVDAGDASACVDAVPALSLGPLLGAITDDSVSVWVRGDSAGTMRVAYWDVATNTVKQSEHVVLSAEHDFTAVARLVELTADTEYEYKVIFAGSCAEQERTEDILFRTLPSRGEPLKLRFFVGADIARTNIPALDDAAAMRPDFGLFIGDNIYADSVVESVDGYRNKYREIWGGEQLRDFMTHIPVFMTWDDHEIRNDYWAGLDTRYTPARQAFDEYQASHNPAPILEGEVFYSFSAGNVDFFMLETRSHRTNNEALDDGSKTMLGEAQLAALESWLLSSDATFKVMVSSVMWADFGTTGADSWSGFRSERQRIIDTIYDNHVEGVVMISGDQHWSAVFRNTFGDPPLVIYEVEPTPLAIGNRTAPASDNPSILFRDDDHGAYGIVDIDTTRTPAEIAFTICATDLPCAPGEEPLPWTALDAPRENDSIPVTIPLTLDDMGFAGGPRPW